jgi:very-short-patch-repair endonuclease
LADSAPTLNIVQELLKLTAGRVRSFLEADFDGVRQQLEGEAPARRRPIVLLKRIEAIPAVSHLINDVVQALATTARNLWPVWFTDVDFGLGRSAADRAAARLRLATLREVHGLSPIWGRRALPKVMEGKLPLVSGFPRATQLHQLRLAISRTGLVLVMALTTKRYDDAQLASLANAARWLAENAKLAVAVLLPSEMEDRPGLAHILYDPVRFISPLKKTSKQSDGFEIALDCETSPTIWVWLGEGRSHPKSEVEAKLAKALANDPELSALFSANQSIETVFKNRPMVDLLWTQGRVVVEVDGDDHREAYKFAADHRRDFELQISDYAVLRLINHEVLTDTAMAVARIREFVHHRRKTRPDLERHP